MKPHGFQCASRFALLLARPRTIGTHLNACAHLFPDEWYHACIFAVLMTVCNINSKEEHDSKAGKAFQCYWLGVRSLQARQSCVVVMWQTGGEASPRRSLTDNVHVQTQLLLQFGSGKCFSDVLSTTAAPGVCTISNGYDATVFQKLAKKVRKNTR